MLKSESRGSDTESSKTLQGISGRRSIVIWLKGERNRKRKKDIDIAVTGVKDFDGLTEKVEELPTLYSVDLINLDTCRNELLLEDIRQYGRKIFHYI